MRFARPAIVVAIITVSVVGLPGFPGAVAPAPAAREVTLPVVADVPRGATVERTVALPWRGNLAGVSFVSPDPEGHGVEILMRARTADGWSEWHDLHVDATEVPDPEELRKASQRAFTGPVWVGLADRVQLRLESEPDAPAVRDFRLHVSNTRGDAVERSAPVRAFLAVSRWLRAAPADVAHAAASKPTIISRKGWGADENLRSPGPGSASRLKMAFVHHTAGSNSYSKSDSAAIVRGIYRYHTITRGYSDIGYNFLVDRHGQIFEGRYGGITRAVIGAHTGGFNTYSTGVALMGTFSSVSPPLGMRRALQRLLAWKLDVHHIPAVGKVRMVSAGNVKYAAGTVVYLNRISGHRDGTSTTCPGAKTYELLPTIRRNVDGMGGRKIYVTSWISTALRPDGDGAHEILPVKAWFNESLSWRLTFYDSSGASRGSFTGSGTSMRVDWDGTYKGELLPSGRYRWRLYDRVKDDRRARSAGGYVYLVGAHPDGSVLTDADGEYVIVDDAVKRVDAVTHTSWYGGLPPTPTGPAERGWFADGGTLGLRNGTLLQGPDAARYIWSDGALRRFADDPTDVFTTLGYSAEAVIGVSQEFLDSLPAGAPVEELTTHPSGSLIRDPEGRRFAILGGQRRPMTDLARMTRYRYVEMVTATAGDLALPEGEPLLPREGALIGDPSGGRPWVMVDGKRKRFLTWTLFFRMGFTKSMIYRPSASDFSAVAADGTYG